ncbi:MAG: uroporphyrinogen decarboxylase family protein [Kiritimatiellae bacterium]|nr:uroporphyrinogen decarboxylase family protein [Kiritimatiellia bacterium]
MLARDIFLAKLHRGAAPRVSAGSATSVVTTDLMQEVGVFFPEAHLDAEAMARLAAAGHEVLGFDNVMPLFSVWHESAALGCQVDWGERGRMPDGRAMTANLADDVPIPANFLEHPGCAIPLRALALLKRRLGKDAAVVGKVFGPWTLAYHVYGVENVLLASVLEPERLKQVIRRLLPVTVAFARAQIDSGADALTLADHCTRDLCSPETYRDFLLDIHAELHARIACPLILHICGDTSDRLSYIRKTGLECFHFDSKVPAAAARTLAGDSLALMGGTSNIAVIRNGDEALVQADVRGKLSAGIDIIGPECAVLLDAPYRNLRTLRDAVVQSGGGGR